MPYLIDTYIFITKVNPSQSVTLFAEKNGSYCNHNRIFLYLQHETEKTGVIVITIGFSYICNMRQERKETILSETGKFLVDIAKLVFGGIILAGIMKYESINSVMLYSVGGMAVIICFLSGLILLTLSKK